MEHQTEVTKSVVRSSRNDQDIPQAVDDPTTPFVFYEWG